MRKQNYDLFQMQEERFTRETGRPNELNVVVDVHECDADKQFAGIVALLP